MFNSYVIIGVLSVALAGAGVFGYYQTKQLGAAEVAIEQRDVKIKEKDTTITNLTSQNSENIKKNLWYQAEVTRIERESAEIQQKAFKDVTRVEEISKKKSKLYEKLVNRDYSNTQRELEELTK